MIESAYCYMYVCMYVDMCVCGYVCIYMCVDVCKDVKRIQIIRNYRRLTIDKKQARFADKGLLKPTADSGAIDLKSPCNERLKIPFRDISSFYYLYGPLSLSVLPIVFVDLELTPARGNIVTA